jgi:hypothetical protein
MIKPQHDSQGKRVLDPGEKRGRQQDRLDDRQECYEVLGARIYGKKYGLDSVCATRYQQFFLTQQVHKETWVGLAVKLWGSINCAGVNSSVKHTRARKHQQKHVI